MAQVQTDQRRTPAASDEAELLARLRARDERAFEALVEAYHGAMLSVALSYVKTRDVAEEVVQEGWLGVLKGIDRFEGRASFRTWVLRILVNTAMTRGGREARTVRSMSRPATSESCFTAPALTFEVLWSDTSMPESSDHITCQEVVELVTDYFEGSLPPDDADLFEQAPELLRGVRVGTSTRCGRQSRPLGESARRKCRPRRARSCSRRSGTGSARDRLHVAPEGQRIPGELKATGACRCDEQPSVTKYALEAAHDGSPVTNVLEHLRY